MSWNKSDPSVGFIGFGDAGSNIAKGLKSAGLTQIFAFDIDPDRVRQNAQEIGIPLLESSHHLCVSARVLISTVTCARAREAAQQTVPFLTPQHIYADLNSVSPALKQQIEQVVVATGTAAATKMFRSIIVKGLEALMLECVLAATPYGADERVFASLSESFPGIDWQRLANYMVGRVIIHGERRAREMEDVAETLESQGIEPIMAEAAARRQDWCAKLGISEQFGPKGPKTYREAVQAIAACTKSHD